MKTFFASRVLHSKPSLWHWWHCENSTNYGCGCEVDIGGGVADVQIWCSNMYTLHLKASFLPVKTSSFNHANIWSLKLQMIHCVVLAVGALPPHVHLKSFVCWMHSYPPLFCLFVFADPPLPYMNANGRQKRWRPGNKARVNPLWFSSEKEASHIV